MIQFLGSRRRLTAAAVAFVVTLSGCSGGDGPADVSSGALDQVTYMTAFGMLGRDSFAFVAKDLGFFAEADLDVTIEPGGATGSNLVGLLTEEVDFTALDMAAAMQAHGTTVSDDENTTVPAQGYLALAAIHQEPLAAVMAYADSGITSVYDLEGRSVGLPTGGVTEVLFGPYAELAGIEPDRVEQVPVEPANLVPALASGEVDAIGQFVVGRGLVERAGDGREVVVMPYSGYLNDLYGVALFTTSRLAEGNPDLCIRMRDALLRGLAYTLEHPDEAGEILARYNPEMPPEVAAAEVAAMTAYVEVHDAEAGQLGGFNEAKVMRGISVMQSIQQADAGLHPDDMVAWDLALPGPDR